MSTLIARKVAGSPIRTSSAAWEAICELIAPNAAGPARAILSRATGVASSSIASEVIKDKPIVVFNSGPRIRIYGLFDEDAMSGEDINEGSLPEVPTNGDWRMSIPCLDEDFDWCKREIKVCAPHISVRRLDDHVPDEERDRSSNNTVRINMEEFLKP